MNATRKFVEWLLGFPPFSVLNLFRLHSRFQVCVQNFDSDFAFWVFSIIPAWLKFINDSFEVLWMGMNSFLRIDFDFWFRFFSFCQDVGFPDFAWMQILPVHQEVCSSCVFRVWLFYRLSRFRGLNWFALVNLKFDLFLDLIHKPIFALFVWFFFQPQLWTAHATADRPARFQAAPNWQYMLAREVSGFQTQFLTSISLLNVLISMKEMFCASNVLYSLWLTFSRRDSSYHFSHPSARRPLWWLSHPSAALWPLRLQLVTPEIPVALSDCQTRLPQASLSIERVC